MLIDNSRLTAISKAVRQRLRKNLITILMYAREASRPFFGCRARSLGVFSRADSRPPLPKNRLLIGGAAPIHTLRLTSPSPENLLMVLNLQRIDMQANCPEN
ncbi:hypothetical protein ADN00_10380 [Ornatilinea apprima]|uniref:Uncharacterized protein n=1 Tax=Ornatilinea apprima TaxID=1134406 RepID=A0A0P6X9T7_9CHLR|nr:hypothetical protein ADN00_10380 [Ornatilinea apprima]